MLQFSSISSIDREIEHGKAWPSVKSHDESPSPKRELGAGSLFTICERATRSEHLRRLLTTFSSAKFNLAEQEGRFMVEIS